MANITIELEKVMFEYQQIGAVVNTLKEAVDIAYKSSDVGDVILLSPACASWDQYKCFEDRGVEFKGCVRKLKTH